MARLDLAWLLGFVVFIAACSTGEPAAPEASVPADGTQPTAEGLAFRNVQGDVAFVGDVACADCHEDLWQGYQEHGMARSYYPLTPGNAVEDFPGAEVHHQASGFYYRAYEQDGQFYQEEYRRDAAGAVTHRLARRMDFVMGSGNAARTYFTENNGRLYQLPLTWYTQAGKWDFSPGYGVANKRFGRLVPERCMACHNSYPQSVAFAEGKYEAVPHGIGCERCHGPGALHVDERLASPEPAGDYDDTIVNPDHLDVERQLDVCQQCHLHTTVSVLREGRGPFDFRPSEALDRYLALFADEAPRAADQISVISHADRMKRSACFLETVGQPDAMNCVTCHNPHEGFRDRGPAYFNNTCQTCHAPDALQARFDDEAARATHTATANCTTCHMPRVEAEEAPHASFTDHWIRVVETEPEGMPAPVAAHDPPVLSAYFERDRQGDEARLYEGIAYVIHGRQQGDSLALKQGIALLEAGLAARPTYGYGEAQYLLGFAHLQLGHVEASIPPLEQAVQRNADIPERLNTLAQAYEAGRRDPLKIGRLYRRALTLQPALADVRVNYGRFLEVQGRLDDAMEQYRLAAEEQPWLAVAHFNLGTAYLQQGAFEEAEAALQQALALQPDYPDALGNLGMLFAVQGQTNQARQQFEQAVAVAPDDATALGNLGTYHLNANDLDQAIALLTRAVEADPAYLDGLLNLALAHFRNDAFEQARQYAQQALQVDPANPRARQILGAL